MPIKVVRAVTGVENKVVRYRPVREVDERVPSPPSGLALRPLKEVVVTHERVSTKKDESEEVVSMVGGLKVAEPERIPEKGVYRELSDGGFLAPARIKLGSRVRIRKAVLERILAERSAS